MDETLGMVLGGGADEFDSGDDDILDDPEFPFPTAESDEESQDSGSGCSSDEGMHLTMNFEEFIIYIYNITCTDNLHGGGSTRGGRGRGGERGRGLGAGRGRGRGAGRGRGRGGRGRGPVPSSLPWRTVSTSTDVAPDTPTFTGAAGPHLELPDDPQPVDFLDEFLDEDLLSLVIEETNQ